MSDGKVAKNGFIQKQHDYKYPPCAWVIPAPTPCREDIDGVLVLNGAYDKAARIRRVMSTVSMNSLLYQRFSDELKSTLSPI